MAEDHERGEEPSGPGWQAPVSWAGLLVLGWLLYELTAQPAVGAATMCVKFGWEDFRTALWLARRDPQRHRGWACFWLYLANGLWKAAVVAFVMGYALTVLGENAPGPRRRQAVNQVQLGIWLTAGNGLLLSTAAALRAIWLAHRHGLRLWLHSAVHRACWADDWPPRDTAPPRINRVGCLVLTGLVLDLALLFLAIIGIGVAPGPVTYALAGFCALMALPSLVQFFRACVLQNFWAESPSDCWGRDRDSP